MKLGTQGGKRRIGWFGWTLRLAGGAVLACVLAFGGFVIYFAVAVYPKLVVEHAAEAKKAQAFARLSGPARRLAIYDAFVSQIDSHYYDQAFSGFDWPKMKRDWRLVAAKDDTVEDDVTLYANVLMPMTHRFPSSHVSVELPTPKVSQHAAPGAAPKRMAVDVGFQVVDLRRSHGVTMVVGEVSPGSAAASAGITPGWLVNTLTYAVEPGGQGDHVHFTGTFTRLTTAQMHALETTGTARLFNADPALSKEAIQARIKSLQTSAAYDVKFTGMDPTFLTRRLPGGILYIRFDHFDAPNLKRVVTALHAAGRQGVVLDLRYNNGGYDLPLLNALLPGLTPLYKVRDKAGLHTISTNLWTQPYTGPLAVLTGPGSASAAEITASILKSRHRAVLVGRATNGAVLGCDLFPLPDGGHVWVPIEDIEMLDGKRLENVGVVPDVEVYPSIDDVRQGTDPAIKIAARQLVSLTRP